MSINRVIISGNLTRDPEIRRTQSGMAIMAIGVAVNDRRRNSQTGEWEDYPNFIDCKMFGTRAESVANYLHKGSKVCIEGKLRYSTWERDGQKRSKVEVVIDEFEFMSSRNDQGSSYQGGGSMYQNSGSYQGGSSYQGGNSGYQSASEPVAVQPTGAPAIDTTSSVYDDDIPF